MQRGSAAAQALPPARVRRHGVWPRSVWCGDAGAAVMAQHRIGSVDCCRRRCGGERLPRLGARRATKGTGRSGLVVCHADDRRGGHARQEPGRDDDGDEGEFAALGQRRWRPRVPCLRVRGAIVRRSVRRRRHVVCRMVRRRHRGCEQCGPLLRHWCEERQQRCDAAPQPHGSRHHHRPHRSAGRAASRARGAGGRHRPGIESACAGAVTTCRARAAQ